MVAPVLALLLLAQPLLLLAEAPRAHEGWLLAESVASTAPEVVARSPREARLLDTGAAELPRPVVAVLDACVEVSKDWGLSAALGLGPSLAARGARVLVLLPVLAAGAGRLEARWLEAPRHEERRRPPGPFAMEGPVTLAGLARETPTPGFTVLLLP